MAIEYRWLKGSDLDVLEPVLAEKGWMSLNNNTSTAIAAFDGDELVGFFVFQLVPHFEPLWVKRDKRGGEVAMELVDRMEDFLHEIKVRGGICIADNPIAEQMCLLHGMKKVESPVYVM